MAKKLLAMMTCGVVLTTGLTGCGTTQDSGSSSSSSSSSSGSSSSSSSSSSSDSGSSSNDTTTDSGDYTIAVVPKLTSIAWFQRMEQGVIEYANETGIDAFYTGPVDGDGALQAQFIEDLIAQKVDAICVVPFSTESLEPVLKKARDAGILVITHEASGMTNIDYDIEAFDNAAYGEHFMERLGVLTGGQGEYIVEVGALTSESHNIWVDSAIALQQEKFPDMSLYGDKIETADSQETSYNKVKEVLTANPNIVGVQGSAMPDIVGAALAVEELGLQGKVHLVGTSLVSDAGKYIKSGTIDTISFWDPALAGKAMIELAVRILDGEEVGDGIDLGIPGYDNLMLDGKVFMGEAWIDVTIDNVDDPAYDF
ncbi:MAG: LacI family transcriptional regulator [Epulopiscium sp. Nuni2H_MBin001]|nr:MAG: LacI family transcriptional regulator [Epulopiscium sp. Nuni2H_MBin001]